MTIAFVAGATGYTGREVVRALRDASIKTVAHVRPDSGHLADWRLRFESLGARVDATPWEPAAMTATIHRLRPDLVFALLGTTRARARDARRSRGADEGYDAVDYGLTALLYRAVAAGAPQARFVYLSATGVPESGGNAYLAARARVERLLHDGTVSFTIARPSFITGPDRDEFRLGERVGAVIADGLLLLAGWFGGKRLRARYRSTTNIALARALVRFATDPGAAGRTLESEDLR